MVLCVHFYGLVWQDTLLESYGKVLFQSINSIAATKEIELPQASEQGKIMFKDLEVGI